MQKVIILILLFSGCVSYAQFGKNCEVSQYKINIVNPGIEYERGIGVNTTLDIKAGMQIALDPAALEPLQDFSLVPAAALQFRYYYNFERRARNGRQIYGNSANYIAPTVAIFVPGTRTVDDVDVKGVITYAGAVTGLQRSYNSGFNFSVDVGAAYYMGAFENGIYPVVNLGIGWIFSEKRWCVGR